jgi:hypothetical protein
MKAPPFFGSATINLYYIFQFDFIENLHPVDGFASPAVRSFQKQYLAGSILVLSREGCCEISGFCFQTSDFHEPIS